MIKIYSGPHLLLCRDPQIGSSIGDDTEVTVLRALDGTFYSYKTVRSAKIEEWVLTNLTIAEQRTLINIAASKFTKYANGHKIEFLGQITLPERKAEFKIRRYT